MLVRSKELAIGMEERLGLSEHDRKLTQNLVSEFQVWLVEECKGKFLTYWGRIDAYKAEDGGFKVWVRPVKQQENESYEPTKVISNYYGELEEEDLIRKLVETKHKG